jgi:hypothetical protein
VTPRWRLLAAMAAIERSHPSPKPASVCHKRSCRCPDLCLP